MSETPKTSPNRVKTSKVATTKKATNAAPKPAKKTAPAKKVTPKVDAPVVSTPAPVGVTTEKTPSLWARIKKVLGL
jgi:hypothetical protein